MDACFRLRRVLVELREGDITEVEADAIVNAANSYLKHGGGVALAIVKKGGDIIQRESDEYVARNGPVPEGQVAVTSAGKLKARYVIHAVGPKFGDPLGDEKLFNAFKNSLIKADELGLKSIAFPAISTGVYGYPYERCAEVAVKVLLSVVGELRNIERIIFCLYGAEAYRSFLEVFGRELRGYTSSC
ncbi:ADP-ribose-binding protein [Infirmifilum lucidum]|uniref:ADP-ribose-binding protein n=1 Tax=Infirmifilum lucidum TaxID=2776706 RepID=A0A7L9FFE0_9CREN|nr:ADP-ribose-binding protein [Infirmifilum lucidum]QOJ78439.1 ADP-ribose-binding protein [Infirmifilum lucidum]